MCYKVFLCYSVFKKFFKLLLCFSSVCVEKKFFLCYDNDFLCYKLLPINKVTIFVKKKEENMKNSIFPDPLIELKNVIFRKISPPRPESRRKIYFNKQRFLELYPYRTRYSFRIFLGAVPGTGRKTLW